MALAGGVVARIKYINNQNHQAAPQCVAARARLVVVAVIGCSGMAVGET